MNEEELNKIISNIKEKIRENKIKVPEYDELNRMAKVNQFDYKFAVSSVFGILGYGTLMFVSAFTRIFPQELIPFIIIGGGITTGALGSMILNKVYKTKERLKTLSGAETGSELLYEEIKSEIELEKARNRNIVLNDALTLIKSNYNTINSMREKYEIQSKNNPKSIEEADKRIKTLEERLEELFNKLDNYSVKKVLNNRFWKLENKGTTIMDGLSYSLVVGIISMLAVDMPFILVKDILPVNLAFLLTPFAAGTLGTAAYNIKRNTDSRMVKNKIEESQEEDTDNNGEPNINDISMDIIVTISNIEEQKIYRDRLLESISRQETKSEQGQDKEIVLEQEMEIPEEKDKPKQYVYKKK